MIDRLIKLFKPNPAVAQLSVEDLRDQLASSAPPLVLDVRSKEEFGFHGHIAGAKLMPVQVLPKRLAEIPADRQLVCVCRTDRRSERAARYLLAQGFDAVMVMTGGMQAWTNAGLPVERHALK